MTSYPRGLTSVHQIEPTTFCNLRCTYCPSPKLEKHRGQPKQHMALDIYDQALELAKHFAAKGTQDELSLTGIGETLLHPDWMELVERAHHALPGHFLNFSTNGLLLTDEACAHLRACGFHVFISLHRPEKAGLAIEHAKRHGILAGVNASAATSAFDWAGQVDWITSAPAAPCEWLRQGWCNVLVDGRITTCCLDASGAGVIGDVTTPPDQLHVKPYSLCESCHMTITDPISDDVLIKALAAFRRQPEPTP